MSAKLNKAAYVRLIEDNIAWLDTATDDCLERDHIKQVLWGSVRCYYEAEVERDVLAAIVTQLADDTDIMYVEFAISTPQGSEMRYQCWLCEYSHALARDEITHRASCPVGAAVAWKETQHG